VITQTGNTMPNRWWPGDLHDAAKEGDSEKQSDDRREDDESKRNEQPATTGARK